MRTHAAIVLLATAIAGAGVAQPASAEAPADAKRLAAESFHHSAVAMACADPDEHARAGRMVVLCEFARRLVPGHGGASALAADIHYAQADAPNEVRALADYLQVFPDDYARRVRWLAASIQPMDSAAARGDFLRAAVDNKALARPARAKAAAMLALLRHGQGLGDDAVAMARRAAELDPYGPAALDALAELVPDPNGAEKVKRLLRGLRGNPRDGWQAWKLGLRLGDLGLHEEAVRLFDHALAADPRYDRIQALPLTQVTQYCSALLDARQADKAIGVLEPLRTRYPESADVRSLLIEAYKAAEQQTKAERLVDMMSSSYKNREAAGQGSVEFIAEIAWFYTVTQPRPGQAIIYAQRAIEEEPNNPVFQRILGAAELAAGKQRVGTDRLEKLLGEDTYASVFLAEWYDRTNNIAARNKAILAAAPRPRSGPAARRLIALANSYRVELPTPPGQAGAAEALADFDRSYLRMILEPASFLTVELAPADGPVEAGEPIEVVATLRNAGSQDIPLGRQGLLRPEMSLKASLLGADGRAVAEIDRLPMAVWPAPRYLAPGKSVSCTVRLDVPAVRRARAMRLTDDLLLGVVGTLTPRANGASGLPSIPAPVARVKLPTALGDFDRDNPDAWPRRIRYVHGRLVYDIRKGDLPARMRAARRVGQLLAHARGAEENRVKLPPFLPRRMLNKPVVLSMVRALLNDSSFAVRQEMIAALGEADLDRTVISLLAPAIEDPAPTVRSRLVELLVSANTRGGETIAAFLAKDPDPLVARMARTVRR